MNEQHVPGRISQLPTHPAPRGLRERILYAVAGLKRRLALRRAIALTMIALISLLGFAEAALYASQELYLSGFGDFMQLMFTDTDVVASSWREIGLSLAESLPALPLALVCVSLLVFLWSTARALANMRIIRNYSSLA
ncbi:MAG: hypothetical protein KGJ34_02180 [Patescibacteria group bacterium]|nr:hypothetical protein [Patescibacteria group bacterium]